MSWLPRRTVIVPVDFSDSSADAIGTALQMVKQPADLHVVHVLIPLETMSPGVIYATLDDPTRSEAAQKYCDEFLQKVGAAGVKSVVRMGDPGHEITEYAKEVQADLIVIPSHGYHGVKRFVLGSVAERVIRHAECAVLVLRRRDAD